MGRAGNYDRYSREEEGRRQGFVTLMRELVTFAGWQNRIALSLEFNLCNRMVKDENAGNYEKLEFWALTALFIFCLPIIINDSAGMMFRYVATFMGLLYINFRAVPQLQRRESLAINILTIVVIVLVIGTVQQLPGLFISSVLEPVAILTTSLFTATMIIGYIVVKRLAVFIVSRSEQIKAFLIIPNRDGLFLLGIWMIVTYWIFIIDVPTEIRLSWTAIIPVVILLHAVSFHYFIPSSLTWRYPLVSYFFKVGLFCIVFANATSITLMVITTNEEFSFTAGALSGIGNFIFTAPALWLIYRWQLKGKEQIYALQNELGRSTANLDFLRSQINPHFLFNALNTIYGLAIHEKAERTAASVEKLGDMMRFMLLENMQEKISLKRELEYLDNYINLQRLRTDGNSQLTITVDIPRDIDPGLKIMPMLLIPFVENAFKHGISLREQSYIKISLELKGLNLYFDVINSRHQKVDNDPERNSNGIGLSNVRLRLQHMYPNKHELMTRQTVHDFFAHLRIDLE